MCINLFPCAEVSVSVPPTASVLENGGTVQVCATLKVVGAGVTTDSPISITLATSDGKG